MLPFNRSWIHQLDRGRVTVRRSSGTITPYLVAQRCRTVLKGGTYGLFCRPKVPCDTQRRHLRGLFVAREHSDKLSREQNALSRSRDNLGRPFREQNAPFRSRDNLGRPSREQNTAFHSRDNLGATVRYGNSTGTLRALLDAAEVRPEPVRLIERLGAFRDGDLDG